MHWIDVKARVDLSANGCGLYFSSWVNTFMINTWCRLTLIYSRGWLWREKHVTLEFIHTAFGTYMNVLSCFWALGPWLIGAQASSPPNNVVWLRSLLYNHMIPSLIPQLAFSQQICREWNFTDANCVEFCYCCYCGMYVCVCVYMRVSEYIHVWM